MQYDLDIRSEHAVLFLHLRSVILSFEQIKEKKNPKQTSYYDSYSTVCMLRVRKGKVRLSFANGARMHEQFKELLGDSRIIRFVEFSSIEDVDVETIKAMIKESLILNLEKYELRMLKKSLSR